MTSIVALYFVPNLGARLGIIAAFMFLLSLILAIATKANRTDIFTATAGYVDPCHFLLFFIILKKRSD
jgi:hypothetical protein